MASSSSNLPLRLYNARKFKLGECVLLEDHLKHKVELSNEERSQKVRVFWDINKAEIEDPNYPIDNFKANITRALHRVDPDFQIDSFIGIGDLSPLVKRGYKARLEHQGIQLIQSTERDCLHLCPYCKQRKVALPYPMGAKIDPPNCSLIKAMIGDVVDRDCQLIILLISGDVDYSSALELLTDKGVKVLLAHGRDSCPLFCTYGHLTWFWDMMLLGNEPEYFYDEGI